MRNLDCSLSFDHIQYTAAELEPLCTWCSEHYPEDASGAKWRAGWVNNRTLTSSSPKLIITSDHSIISRKPPQLAAPFINPTPEPAPSKAPVTQVRKRKSTVPNASSKRLNTSTVDRLPEELGKLVSRDVSLLRKLGWKAFVKHRRRRGDFAALDQVQHPAKKKKK